MILIWGRRLKKCDDKQKNKNGPLLRFFFLPLLPLSSSPHSFVFIAFLNGYHLS
jgi:hypothetical protein